MRAKVHDLETQNVAYFGGLASPYCPENYVVMDAYEYIDMGKGTLTYSERVERRYANRTEFLAKWAVDFTGVDIYVAHNAAYEMSWLMEYSRESFLSFLARGGRVYCTAYAHYLVSNMQDIFPSLNDTAPIYGGTQKVDAVKALWEAGVLTADIDSELLSEYLSGPGGDIANTSKVFLGTWKALTERKMLTMALCRMDALVFSALCMHNGLKVDNLTAQELMQENISELERLTQQVYTLLPEDMPEVAREQFSFGSDYHVSALIFGGPMVYKDKVHRTDADGNLIYVKEEGPFFKRGKDTWVKLESECTYDAEVGLWYDPVEKCHQALYTAGKNKGLPKVDKIVTDEVDTKWGELLYFLPGLLLDSHRVTFKDALERDWVGKRKLRDESPVYSSAADTLNALAAHKVPGCKDIQQIGKIDKDLGSFYLKQKFDAEGNVKEQKGMLQFVNEDAFIHHTLNHVATVTARLSASTPNMQQLPRAEEGKPGDFKSKVKQVFVSRFGEDGGILQEDYSALETVGLQVFTKDPALKKYLMEGTDMHSLRLANMRGETYEYVLARTKDEDHPEHNLYNELRTSVKAPSFLYQYGGSAYAMVMTTGLSMEFCEQFIEGEKALFPGVEEWFEKCVFQQVHESSLTRRPTRLQLDDGRYKLIRTGVYISPEGTTYQWSQKTKEKWNPVTRKREEISEFKVPEMRNYPIQGGSGFFVQLATGMLARHLVKNNFYNGLCLPINTVHDAVYFDCHKDVVYQAAYEIEAILECIPEMLNKLWPAFEVSVPFPVAGGFGPNMAVERKVYTPEGKAEFMAKKSAFKKEFLAAKGLTPLFA